MSHARLPERGKIRKFHKVTPRRPGASSPKSAHPLRYVGHETGTGLFPIISDIDPCGELPLDDCSDRRFYLPCKFLVINGFSALLADQEGCQGMRARKTADMGGKNPLFTPVHTVLLPGTANM
jgi:hypothetical protein